MDACNRQERSLTPYFVDVKWDDDLFIQLPDEVLIKIFSYLPIEMLAEIPLVCRRWCRLEKDDSIWKGVALRNDCRIERLFSKILDPRDRTARFCIQALCRSGPERPVFDAYSFLKVDSLDRSITVQKNIAPIRLNLAIKNLLRTSRAIPDGTIVWNLVPQGNRYVLDMYIKNHDGRSKHAGRFEYFDSDQEINVKQREVLFKRISQEGLNCFESYEEFQVLPYEEKNPLKVDLKNLIIRFEENFSWYMIPKVCNAFKKNKEIPNGSFTYFNALFTDGVVEYVLIFKNHQGDVKKLKFKANKMISESKLGGKLLHLIKTEPDFARRIQEQGIEVKEIREMLSQCDNLGEEELDTPFMYQRFESIF